MAWVGDRIAPLAVRECATASPAPRFDLNQWRRAVHQRGGIGQKRSYSSPLTSPASVSSTLVSSCPIFMMLLTVSWAPTIWAR
jgi:hypothetical protein